jgi:hypothetical protein
MVKVGIYSRNTHLQTYSTPASPRSPRLNRATDRKRTPLFKFREFEANVAPGLYKHFCCRTIEYATLLAKERVSNDRAENGTHTDSSFTKLPR